jgi:hypothetical protein
MGRWERCFSSVALGDPGVPVICWPMAVAAKAAVKATLMVVLTASRFITCFFIAFLLLLLSVISSQ